MLQQQAVVYTHHITSVGVGCYLHEGDSLDEAAIRDVDRGFTLVLEVGAEVCQELYDLTGDTDR